VRILHLNWRKEALYVTLVAAEMCWFTPWSLVLTRQALVRNSVEVVVLAPYGTALILGILVLAAVYFSRILDLLRLDLLYQRGALIVAVVITTPLVIRFLLYPNYGWLELGWLGKAGASLLRFYSLPPETSISAATLFLWWRGISIGQRNLTFQGVAFSFRLGILLLISSSLLLSIVLAYSSTGFILLFFFFSLMAVALARVEEVSRAKGGVGAPFNVAWLAILLGSIVTVLITAWLISHVYSFEGFSQVLRWLQPVFSPLLKIVEFIFSLLTRLLSPILEWLFRVLQGAFARLGQNVESFENLTLAPPLEFEEGETVQPPRLLMDALRYVCLGLIGVGILAVLALGVRRRRESRRKGSETRESLWSSAVLADGMLNSLRNGWDRLKDLAGLVGRFGPGMRLYAAVSIRKIYANMTRLAERQGFPRQPAQTPYEYLPVLSLAFPDCQAEATAITEAYVKVHYGEVPESVKDLQVIRECWEQIQQRETSNVKRET
jgi:hypothetical protein